MCFSNIMCSVCVCVCVCVIYLFIYLQISFNFKCPININLYISQNKHAETYSSTDICFNQVTISYF